MMNNINFNIDLVIEIEDGNKYWGIKENDTVVVPVVHPTKESAIEEWKYFEMENTKSPFLNRVMKEDEINLTVTKLINQE